MTVHKTLLGAQHKRPERKFKEVREEAREADRHQNKNGIDKRFTGLKTATSSTKDHGDLESGVSHPSEEQLDKINEFTRSTKTAEELVVFPTLSCNDIVDRDYDQFTKDTVKGFAELPEPYSSVGKSFMVGHDYNKLPVGRIFDVGTKTVDGNNYLTNWVYMPNTEANKDFIDNVEFGINWAVSVGVMLGSAKCAICDSPVSSFMGFCYENGHMKGMYYDPNSDDVDNFGWAEPVDPDTKGAQLAYTKLEEPRDFYELSQVFLGAQYFAALDDKSTIDGIVKAASAAGVPVVGLSKDEAEELPIPHVPEQVHEAADKYDTETDEEGQVYWTDDKGLRWVFNPEDSEVLCLGRNELEDENATTDEERQSGSEGTGAEEQRESDGGSSGTGSGEDDKSGSDDRSKDERESGNGGTEDPGSSTGTSVDDSKSSEREESEEEEEEEDVEKAIRAAAAKAKIPQEVLDEAVEKGGPLLENLLSKLVQDNARLTAKAAIGDNYLKDLRADAIAWYVKAHQEGEDKPIKTETFERLLDRCGDDDALIKDIIEEKKALAKAKFPDAVRRSTFPTDVNRGEAPDHLPDDWDKDNDERVSRLHG